MGSMAAQGIRSRLLFAVGHVHGPLHFSLHDALPISAMRSAGGQLDAAQPTVRLPKLEAAIVRRPDCRLGRSEEHTSELQSHSDLVCRLLLEKNTVHAVFVLDGKAEIAQPVSPLLRLA